MLKLSLRAFVVLLTLTITAKAETQSGIASVYGNLDGQQYSSTSNGERVYPNLATCAHKTAKFNTIIQIKNLANGEIAYCRVNDRGPFKAGRIIDITSVVAKILKMSDDGLTRVVIHYTN